MAMAEKEHLPVLLEAAIFFVIAIVFLSIADYFKKKKEKELCTCKEKES